MRSGPLGRSAPRPAIARFPALAGLRLLAASRTSSPRPALRANPFPEVTDPFCRLPLPTLLRLLEASHLGDLMRLWVRPSENDMCATGFSRASRGAPDTATSAVLFQPPCPIAE